MLLEALESQIDQDVRQALAEDMGSGDITAQLIPEDGVWKASVYSRDNAILCGRNWFDAVFHHLDERTDIRWYVADGELIAPHQVACTLKGPARALLSGERTALNFLQTLSGTATLAHRYAKKISDLKTRVLDTRKTIPGLRRAQKYAVRCGGCHNHRMGLYDAFLIKENHIRASGSIAQAINAARDLRPDMSVEIEVENLHQLEQALEAGADRVLLDNFTPQLVGKAVKLTDGRAELEVSGNITLDNLRQYAQTGVDYVSIGALTKNLAAVDLSMRFD
jgi:nicotinate-nucleotide pyrophosphorylase (carboxylating)